MATIRKVLIALCLIVLSSLFSEEKKYDVLGLSAAILDHYFMVSEEQLKSMTHEKGGWAPIDYSTLSLILSKNSASVKVIPGGGGANVIKGLCSLGEKCAMLGKVGSDDKGDYYFSKLKEMGVTPLLRKGSLPTGQAVCLITPDGERTFRTYLGASHSLSDLEFDPEIFKEIRLFHIEGYQLVNPDLVLQTLKIAKEFGTMISIDLANVEIIRRNKVFIEEVLENYIDIVFCNEMEAKELTGLSASRACDKLATLCSLAVVTMGEKGSWARWGSKKVYMEAFSTNVIDTTGAGDLYASGFLHGYLEGASLKKCAWLGSYVASQVVKRIGAEIPPGVWEDIRQTILEEGKTFD